ncbi:MAG TPA: PP2C family protein-serine/threonine phosphatase [Terracidiphilus sp.]
MRGTILKLAVALVCGTALAAAQSRRHATPTPRSPAEAGRQTKTAAAGPVFDASALGSPVILDHGWRVGISSDPEAAQPGFDDSAWAVRDASQSMESVPGDTEGPRPPPPLSDRPGPPSKRGPRIYKGPGPEKSRNYAWFRMHIKLPPNHGPVALLILLPVSQNTSVNLGSTGWGVDVFANGKQIEPEGPHGSDPRHYQQISRVYDLGLAPDETSLTLVLRTLYIPLGFDSYTNFFAARKVELGNRADLDNALGMWSAEELFERLPRLVDSILLGILALFLLALYYSQRGHPEYLWLALHEALQAPIAFVELAGSSAYLDSLWYAAIVLALLVVSAYVYFEFLIAFLALPRRWHSQGLRYTAPILALVGPMLLLVGHSAAIGVALAVVMLGCMFWIVGWFLFIFVTLITATLRHNYEAGLLLLALVLSIVGMLEPVITTGMNDWTGRQFRSPLTVQTGPIPIHFAAIADFIGIFVIVLIIFVRFLRIQADQEQAKTELAAARSVQELMIPQQNVQTPGFEVDSAYQPAQEVGGDFFHVQATAEGGLLVVIGDVAGKGLTAAMNVSMLMGALRQSRERSPAKILAALNRVLAGSGSFTTCQAAWFGADGELVVANAGHLPPYLNSQEVALPGGLPLGVLEDGEYPETRLYLHPGDRILMCSDGVVEARGESGELFGFERVHNLSNQSAFYVAEAAKDFGQEDDITVLTVKRAPVAAGVMAMAGT